MRQTLLLSTLLLTCALAVAQSQSEAPATAEIFRSTSTMVTVPALVRSPKGEFVNNLDIAGVELYDNGIRQSVKLAATEQEPIALVVVVQTGGPGDRHFLDYLDLPAWLDWLLNGTNHEIMLVEFDGRVELIWHFPVRSDGVAHSLTHLHSGDGGAAIMDAVQYGVDQLQSEPGSFRRIVLLLSQEKDQGSTRTPEEVLQILGKGSTAVYSLSFAAAKTKPAATPRRAHGKTPPPTPLDGAIQGLREHTATKLASYTGGAHAAFADRRDFIEAIKAISADIHHRYALAFQPNAHEAGIHRLTIKVRDGYTATARNGYWFDPVSHEK
jgi:VWFA-related protein